jgi:predicted membrane protein
MPSANRPLVPPRLVLGMVTFVLGALFLADGANLLRADSALAFWPVALLALGLVVALQPDPANRIVGALLLIAGVWLLLNAVGIWSYRFWQTWPYLLIVFGAWMIYRVYQLREKARRDGWVTGFAFLNSVATPGPGAPVAAGEVSAVAGECAIDLRSAQMGESPLIVDVFALFGRITVLVPSGWRVETRVLPLLGRVTDTPQIPAGAAPTIVVQGSAICSSVEVGVVSESCVGR